MKRTYTLKKRAEQQAETRQRIAEATLELHRTVGPARTTLSMIAERAGVQRHTLYAHFPEERDLFVACSALAEERDPMPDAAPWGAVEDARQRLRTGLSEVYGWFERNADLATCVLRDIEVHPLVQETAARSFVPSVTKWHAVLGEKLTAEQRPLLHLALSFHSWRTLVQESGMESAGAVEVMVNVILAGG